MSNLFYMKTNKLIEYVNLLDNDIIPNVFSYKLTNKINIDYLKVYYNDTYFSSDYFNAKFPFSSSIIGFDSVINDIANNAISPLDEILERQKISN